MNNKNKVRFFRWTGGPDSGCHFSIWKVRKDGSSEGTPFKGDVELRKLKFNWESLDSIFCDERWEEITEAEAALII